jgi:hypothetical protein
VVLPPAGSLWAIAVPSCHGQAQSAPVFMVSGSSPGVPEKVRGHGGSWCRPVSVRAGFTLQGLGVASRVPAGGLSYPKEAGPGSGPRISWLKDPGRKAFGGGEHCLLREELERCEPAMGQLGATNPTQETRAAVLWRIGGCRDHQPGWRQERISSVVRLVVPWATNTSRVRGTMIFRRIGVHEPTHG